jgi:hypothetical protein
MKSIHIGFRSSGSEQSWFDVYADGRIQYHTENDGPRFMRHGLEAEDTWISLEQLPKSLTDEYKAAIIKLNEKE